MATTTGTENTETTTTEHLRTADAHAAAAHAASTPVLHPVRPVERRPLRDPHSPEEPAPGGARTTPAGDAPSSARLRHTSPRATTVAPTAVPDNSVDLIGLPDFLRDHPVRRLVSGIASWVAREVRGAAETDARIRAGRDESAAGMLHAGVLPNRFS